jgi:ABC-type transporter Mla subunit MlaD
MGSAGDGDAAAGFRGKLMATMPNLDKAIEQFEQAMRQLEAAWAQSSGIRRRFPSSPAKPKH